MRTISPLLAASLISCAQARGETKMIQPTTSAALEPLFHAELQFQSASEKDAVVDAEGHEGAYIGSGDGTVAGSIRGTLRWSFWSGNCLYPLIRKGQPVPKELHLCTMNPSGYIETADGARIRFDGRGYGLRSP